MPDTILAALLYFVVPVWLLAGLADWVCHRAADIEHTAGVKESLMHLLMFGEIAVPMLACLFLEIDSLVILIGIMAFFAHEATALWDVGYAVKRRVVTPFEQHMHSFLELMPLIALLLICLLHWGQFLALFGFGPEPARFALAWKEPPLPAPLIGAILGAALLLEIVPYLEELARGTRTRR